LLSAAFLGLWVISNSMALIAFNKWLLHEDRFPFPAALTALHQAGVSLLTALLFAVSPGSFPTVAVLSKQTGGFLTAVAKRFLPVGICLSGTLFLSNAAYRQCSVGFCQMMKATNVCWVYVGSSLFGLDIFSWQRFVILVWIVFFMGLAAANEVHFSFRGFLTQVGSQCFEVVRFIVIGLLLRGAEQLDALTVMLLQSPVCFVFLSIFAVVTWDERIPEAALELFPWLGMNVLLAFSLNFAITTALKAMAPTSYNLLSPVKDSMVLAMSALVFHDPVPLKQAACFGSALLGLYVHTNFRLRPDLFSQGLGSGIVQCFLPRRPLLWLASSFGFRRRPTENVELKWV